MFEHKTKQNEKNDETLFFHVKNVEFYQKTVFLLISAINFLNSPVFGFNIFNFHFI